MVECKDMAESQYIINIYYKYQNTHWLTLAVYEHHSGQIRKSFREKEPITLRRTSFNIQRDYTAFVESMIRIEIPVLN